MVDHHDPGMSAMESPWLLTPINVLYQAIAHPLLLVIYGILISLYWIASPLVYLGHFLVQAGSLPIHFLAKLEVTSLVDDGWQPLIYIFPDTLYLFRRRSYRRTDDRSDSLLPVKDQYAYSWFRRPAVDETKESTRPHGGIIQGF